MEKTSYHHGNLKISLIHKAEELIESGETDISLRRLARLIGVSHTAPYRHFKNWEELQHSIKINFLESLNKELSLLSLGQRSSEHKIKDYARKLIEISILRPQKFVFLSIHPSENTQAHRAELSTVDPSEAIFKLLVKLCVQHLHEQELRKSADPFLIASSLWCSFFGIAHLIHSGWIPFDKKSVYGEKLLDGCLQTILPRS